MKSIAEFKKERKEYRKRQIIDELEKKIKDSDFCEIPLFNIDIGSVITPSINFLFCEKYKIEELLAEEIIQEIKTNYEIEIKEGKKEDKGRFGQKTYRPIISVYLTPKKEPK